MPPYPSRSTPRPGKPTPSGAPSAAAPSQRAWTPPRDSHAAPPAPAAIPTRVRTRAALCYAIPVVPAVLALLKRREHPYVRLHAARALLFFACVALAQLILLGFLLIGGAYARDLLTGALLGLVAWAYLVVEFVVALRVWRRSLAAALVGANPLVGRLGPGAALLERWTLSATDAISLRRERLLARLYPTGKYDDRAWR